MQETMIDYKQNIYQELSRLTKGLGSEKRLDILNILLDLSNHYLITFENCYNIFV